MIVYFSTKVVGPNVSKTCTTASQGQNKGGGTLLDRNTKSNHYLSQHPLFPRLDLQFPQPSFHHSQHVNQARISSRVLCGETFQSHAKDAKSTTRLPNSV